MSNRAEYDKQYYLKHKERINEKNKANYYKNREKILAKKKEDYCPDNQKDKHLKNKYNISLEKYNSMYDEQKGRCYICGDKHTVLHVDHNHETGEVRKLLCSLCNTSFGKMRERVDLIEKLLEYSKAYGKS